LLINELQDKGILNSSPIGDVSSTLKYEKVLTHFKLSLFFETLYYIGFQPIVSVV